MEDPSSGALVDTFEPSRAVDMAHAGARARECRRGRRGIIVKFGFDDSGLNAIETPSRGRRGARRGARRATGGDEGIRTERARRAHR